MVTREDISAELEKLCDSGKLTLDEYQRLKRIFEIGKQAFCKECGKPIPVGSLYCKYCGDQQGVVQTAYCEECGKQIPSGSIHCPYCSDKQGAP